MSGRLPIHVNTANHPTTALGGVDLRMQTIAEALASAGYHCHTAGKWHAGGHSVGQLPTQRGFDRCTAGARHRACMLSRLYSDCFVNCACGTMARCPDNIGCVL